MTDRDDAPAAAEKDLPIDARLRLASERAHKMFLRYPFLAHSDEPVSPTVGPLTWRDLFLLTAAVGPY
jgi:hypothetical protein